MEMIIHTHPFLYLLPILPVITRVQVCVVGAGPQSCSSCSVISPTYTCSVICKSLSKCSAQHFHPSQCHYNHIIETIWLENCQAGRLHPIRVKLVLHLTGLDWDALSPPPPTTEEEGSQNSFVTSVRKHALLWCCNRFLRWLTCNMKLQRTQWKKDKSDKNLH